MRYLIFSRPQHPQSGAAALEVALLFAIIMIASITGMMAMGYGTSKAINRGANALGTSLTNLDGPLPLGRCGEANPPLGTVCGDGSVFIGLSQDPDCGGCKVLAARCDVGASWNGSSCTGMRQTLTWDDGSGSGVDTPAPNVSGNVSHWTGAADSATIAGTDANPMPDFQPHRAAAACADYVGHTRGDWHLPAVSELALVHQQRAAIGGFAPVPSGYGVYYWSSTEATADKAMVRIFPTGNSALDKERTVSAGGYALGPYVRCVRLQQ